MLTPQDPAWSAALSTCHSLKAGGGTVDDLLLLDERDFGKSKVSLR
ncbi:hypothetical protein [Deinococcus arenae]|nr:hypothetical protein [Deinococcus arenae]